MIEALVTGLVVVTLALLVALVAVVWLGARAFGRTQDQLLAATLSEPRVERALRDERALAAPMPVRDAVVIQDMAEYTDPARKMFPDGPEGDRMYHAFLEEQAAGGAPQ